MKYLVFITINLIMLSTLLAVTWEIRQDGTGDFTTIGAGITVAQDGDILLVYPGIYYERINYQGKNITITSLYDGDEYDESYIANTIIDGNHEGTVVIFNSGETRDAILNGFTIRHGFGEVHTYYNIGWFTQAGGIFIRLTSPIISNCIVEYNQAFFGGGIELFQGGNPYLKGNTIRYNHALFLGGGVSVSGLNVNLTDMEFCPHSRNSIYLNNASYGSDMAISRSEQVSILLDTLTVLTPDEYFIINTVPDLDIVILNGKIEPVCADLYVNPEGDDSNSGLSPYEPIQTISRAMATILPDSLHHRTIHLAEGVYSPSINNQLFPVQLRKYITLKGAGRNQTILDGEHDYWLLSSIDNIDNNPVPIIRNFTVKNLSLINGSNINYNFLGAGAIYLHFIAAFELNNVDVINCHSNKDITTAIYHPEGDYVLKDIFLSNNSGGDGLSLSHTWGEYHLYAENILVKNQQPGPLLPDYAGGTGVGIRISANHIHTPLSSTATIVNLDITDCLIDNVDPVWSGLPYGNVFLSGPGYMRVINATIGNNFSTNLAGGGLAIWDENVHVEVINSIIYGNYPHNIALRNDHDISSSLTVSHSLVGGGEDGINYWGYPCNFEVNWGEGNIDADPLWLGEVDPDYTGDYPYMLSEYSPARNAGTLDIPNFEFPEYDLAGNPRISGTSIDIGAYEYQEFHSGIDSDENLYQDLSFLDYNLYNYPNPIVNLKGMGRGKGVGTNISFIMPKEGNVVIDIYNVKGQFIRRLINAYMVAGEYSFLWNGKDEQERVVATGFYMYRLEIDGETVATGRCTFIK